jgi:hypothetical protein
MRSTHRVLLLSAGVLLANAIGFGQAWVPPKGEGEMALSYQNLFNKYHYNGDGSRHDYGHVRAFRAIEELDYGVTDKFAVNVSLPYGYGKYHGPYPHQLPIDNGNYHGALQDFRVGFRYNVVKRPIQFTPFLAVVFPSHHYEHFGHSAVGIDMWEAQIGMSLGRSLAPVLPRGYFQLSYGYSIVQRVLGMRPNRSRIDTEFGYFLTRRLSLQAIAASQIVHSGLDFPQDFPVRSPTNVTWRHHDQILAINFLNMGGGIVYSITKNWQVYSSLLTSVWGQNGHALQTGFSAGMSWTFRTPWARQPVEVAASGQETEGLDLRTAKLIAPPAQQPCH